MKKLAFSVITAAALSSLAIAGGDIQPVEPVVETPVVVEEPLPGNFYIGAGYSYMDFKAEEVGGPGWEEFEANAIALLAGYNFNEYIGLEGRYSLSLGDLTYSEAGSPDVDFKSKMSNLAIYLKPMLPLDEGITLYGLLGYGKTTLDLTDNGGDKLSENGFQWGVGASIALNESVSLFADYTNLYNGDDFDGGYGPGSADVNVYAVNVGLTMKF